MSGVIFYLTILAASISAICWAKPTEFYTSVPKEFPQDTKWVSHRDSKVADPAFRVSQVKHSAEVPTSRIQRQLNLVHINAEVSGSVPVDINSEINYADVVVNGQHQENENPAKEFMQIVHNTQNNAAAKSFSIIENIQNRITDVEHFYKTVDSTINFDAPIAANLMNSQESVTEQVNNQDSVIPNLVQSVNVPEYNITFSASDMPIPSDDNLVRTSHDSIVFPSNDDSSTFIHAEVHPSSIGAAKPSIELIAPVEISLNNQDDNNSNFLQVQPDILESKSSVPINAVPISNAYLSPIEKIPNYGGTHISDHDTEVIESLPPIYRDNETEIIDSIPHAEEHPQFADFYPPEPPQYNYNMTQPEEIDDVPPQPENPQHDYDLQPHPEEQEQPQYEYDPSQQSQYDYDLHPLLEQPQQPQYDYDVQSQPERPQYDYVQQEQEQPQYDYDSQNQPQQSQYDYDAQPQPEEPQQPQYEYDVQHQPAIPEEPQYDYDGQLQQEGQYQPQYDYDTQNQQPSYEYDTQSQPEELQQRQYDYNVQLQQPQFNYQLLDRTYLPSFYVAKS